MPDREIAWLKPARKAFDRFPAEVRGDMLAALTIASQGGKADIAKPLKGFDDGVFEIALRYRGDAFRAVYALRIGPILWIVDAFQKKSTTGIKTAKVDIERIKQRVRRLKESYA